MADQCPGEPSGGEGVAADNQEIASIEKRYATDIVVCTCTECTNADSFWFLGKEEDENMGTPPNIKFSVNPESQTLYMYLHTC